MTCPRSYGPRPTAASLAGAGMVEVVSSLERDGRPVLRDLRWGVYVDFPRRLRNMCAAASPNTG